MSAAGLLCSWGLTLSLEEDGELVLDGLQQLSLEGRGCALRLAKEHRLHIRYEVEKAGGVLFNPYVAHYRTVCECYPSGCEACIDSRLSSLDFCRKYPMSEWEEA
jgi:hypothetical protein